MGNLGSNEVYIAMKKQSDPIAMWLLCGDIPALMWHGKRKRVSNILKFGLIKKPWKNGPNLGQKKRSCGSDSYEKIVTAFLGNKIDKLSKKWAELGKYYVRGIKLANGCQF